jgi:hypothetical protein
MERDPLVPELQFARDGGQRLPRAAVECDWEELALLEATMRNARFHNPWPGTPAAYLRLRNLPITYDAVAGILTQDTANAHFAEMRRWCADECPQRYRLCLDMWLALLRRTTTRGGVTYLPDANMAYSNYKQMAYDLARETRAKYFEHWEWMLLAAVCKVRTDRNVQQVDDDVTCVIAVAAEAGADATGVQTKTKRRKTKEETFCVYRGHRISADKLDLVEKEMPFIKSTYLYIIEHYLPVEMPRKTCRVRQQGGALAFCGHRTFFDAFATCMGRHDQPQIGTGPLYHGRPNVRPLMEQFVWALFFPSYSLEKQGLVLIPKDDDDDDATGQRAASPAPDA